MQPFKFDSANVLLTGGTGEIGRGFLKSLESRKVANVFVPGSNESRLNQLHLDFPSIQITPVLTDLSSQAGLETLVESIQKKLSGEKLDLTIFNAGMLGLGGGESYPTWDNALKTMALNVLSPEFCFRRMVELNILKPGSCVLAAGSIAGHHSYPESKNIGPYTISKAGLHRAVKNWAMDHADMTIFELAFGAVQTKMLDQCRPPDVSEKEWNDLLLEDIPIKEITDPNVLTETVVQFLETPGYRLFHGDVVHLSGGERNA